MVHYEDVEGWDGAYEQNGYVYTWTPTEIKLLKQEYAANIHNYTGLLWYLRKIDGGMYNLIDIDCYINQGYNTATIREISLTSNGDEVLEKPADKFGTAQGEPISDEEYDAFIAEWKQIESETIFLSPFSENIDSAVVLCRGNS